MVGDYLGRSDKAELWQPHQKDMKEAYLDRALFPADSGGGDTGGNGGGAGRGTYGDLSADGCSELDWSVPSAGLAVLDGDDDATEAPRWQAHVHGLRGADSTHHLRRDGRGVLEAGLRSATEASGCIFVDITCCQ